MRVISGTDVTGLSQSFRLFWLVVVPIAGMRSLTYRKMWRHHFRARLLRAAQLPVLWPAIEHVSQPAGAVDRADWLKPSRPCWRGLSGQHRSHCQ